MLFGISSLTPYSSGRLTQQSYLAQPATQIDGWQLYSQAGLNDYGYHGVAYIHEADKLMAIIHRGTNPELLSNLLSDVTLALGEIPPAQANAQAFSTQVRRSMPADYQSIELGHSLGGFHAELNAAHFDSLCITFESPGTAHLITRDSPAVDHTKFIGFLSIPNVINVAKPHVGTLYRIYIHHVDAGGHRVDKLMATTESMLKATNPSAVALTVGRSLVEPIISADLQHHELNRLVGVMDAHLGYPWLMRQMHTWPSLSALLQARITPSHYQPSAWSEETLQPYPALITQNRRYEQSLVDIAGYAPGTWIAPARLAQALEDESNTLLQSKLRAYVESAFAHLAAFHEDTALHDSLIQTLGVPAEWIPPSPTVEMALAKPALREPRGFTSSKPNTSSSLLISPQGHGSARILAFSPSSSSMMDSSSPKPLKVLPSVVSTTHVVETSKWVISLVKSAGDREHAFLVLEGIDAGERVMLRSDLFLNASSRAELRPWLPKMVGDAITSIRGFSEQVAGSAFVRVAHITPESYDKLLQDCQHQSFSITRHQAQQLLTRLAREAEKPYTYTIAGNHPSSSVSSVSSTEAHNCVSWCQKILKEELDIDSGSRWALVKKPSTVVAAVIAAEAGKTQSAAPITPVSGNIGGSTPNSSSLLPSTQSSTSSTADAISAFSFRRSPRLAAGATQSTPSSEPAKRMP